MLCYVLTCDRTFFFFWEGQNLMDMQREISCLIEGYDRHILADVVFVASSRRSDMIAR